VPSIAFHREWEGANAPDQRLSSRSEQEIGIPLFWPLFVLAWILSGFRTILGLRESTPQDELMANGALFEDSCRGRDEETRMLAVSGSWERARPPVTATNLSS